MICEIHHIHLFIIHFLSQFAIIEFQQQCWSLDMRKIIMAMLVLLPTLLHANSPYQCEIFSENNFKGLHGKIVANDEVRFHSENAANNNRIVRSDAKRIFYDATWRDNVGSVKVGPACHLVTWDKLPRGTHRVYRGENPTMLPVAAGQIAAAYCKCPNF